jgi:hypothetical protein
LRETESGRASGDASMRVRGAWSVEWAGTWILTINDISIGTSTITVQFEIYLVRSDVKSHFEINGRSRVISFEAHTVGNVIINEVQAIQMR